MSEERQERSSSLLTRRQALKAIGMGAVGIALAACGGGAGSTPTAPVGGQVSTPTSSPQPSPTTAPSPSAAPGGKPTMAPTPLPPTPVVQEIGRGTEKVIFWHGLGGADGETMQVLLQKYTKEKGIAVRSETYDWGLFYQKLPTSIIAGTPPDMAIMHEWAMAQFGTQGVLQSADDLFFNAGILDKSDYNEEILKKITIDGVAYGVPWDNHGWGLWYNTKLIKDAGLDPNKLPKNGQEYLEWCYKLTTDENGKHPDENGFNPKKVAVYATHPSWLRPTLLSTIWQFGGEVFDPVEKKASLDSENCIKAVQYWVDLVHEHRVAAPTGAGTTSPADLYANNRLVLMWEGSWMLNFFKDRPKLLPPVTKAASLPSLSDGTQAAWMSAHIFVIPNGIEGDRLERAKNLIKWLEDHNAEWADSGQVPAKLSVQNSGIIQKLWSVSAFAKEFQTIGRTEPQHVAITEIQAQYEPAFDAALNKVMSVKDALTQANRRIQDILDRY